uniref:Uncharacterized protein n=1 Tax=Arundo donax TaxID=35708 RepID=A0A0A9HML2_ARUDO
MIHASGWRVGDARRQRGSSPRDGRGEPGRRREAASGRGRRWAGGAWREAGWRRCCGRRGRPPWWRGLRVVHFGSWSWEKFMSLMCFFSSGFRNFCVC